MNRITSVLLAFAALSLIASTAQARPHEGHDRIVIIGDHVGDSTGIHLEHDEVVIDGDTGQRARITSDGELFIDGKAVAVDAGQRAQLREYAKTTHDIETRAVRLGLDAAGFAMDVAGEAFALLAAGGDEDAVERHADARAKQFQQRALPICADVDVLRNIQEHLAATLPAFKPFSVIDDDEADECRDGLSQKD
ncbi:MAG TPA: DUF2884 family protein [Gammaproteobacteria bacterium]|nr:DUF2884 family protein [Gammaproteobacteria bacterium]